MRVRTLQFNDTPEDREKFELIYQGFVTGGNGTGSKGIEERRREVTILRKMEAISSEVEESKCESCGNVQRPKRVLNDGPQSLELTVPEFEITKKYFEATPWTMRVSGKIVDISDWMLEAPIRQT